MNIDTRLNLIGFTYEEAKPLCENAAVTVGLEPNLLVDNFRTFAKVFIQRRKIVGHEAIFWVGILAMMTDYKSPLRLSTRILSGILVDTPNNGSTVRERMIMVNRDFETVGEVLAAFEAMVQTAKEEEAQKVNPTKPILSRANYDVLAALEGVANTTYRHTLDLNSFLWEARQDALSYCPTDMLGDQVEEIGSLSKTVFILRRKVEKLLDKLHEVREQM